MSSPAKLIVPGSGDRLPVVVLHEALIRESIPLDLSVVDAVEAGFVAGATRRISMPPVMQVFVPDGGGKTCIKSAWIEGEAAFAVKLSSSFQARAGAFSEPNGLMVLVESMSGRVRAVFLDNGYLTQIRTAAAGAVVARHMAPASLERVAVLGSGKQALHQLVGLRLVRSFTSVSVWARDPEAARRFAAKVEAELEVETTVAATPAAAVARAQLAITATSARAPLLSGEDVPLGLHITAMGSDAVGKRELAWSVLARSSLYVADSLAQTRILGELQDAPDGGEQSLPRVTELGQLIADGVPARSGSNDITIADLTGLGVQDTAIALELWRRVQQSP